jgi:hypothetical protein
MDPLKELDGLDFGHYLAIIKKLGGRKMVDALLHGEIVFEPKELIRLLVDKTGRLIPAHLGITAAVCDENRDFLLNQPSVIDYGEILARFRKFFPAGTKFVNAIEFMTLAEAAKEESLASKLLANLFKRAAWPLPIPQHEVHDMGKSMDEFFLPAAKAAYLNQFPDRKFNIYCGDMPRKVLPLPDYNGHDKFIAKMKDSPGVAWYFPNPMQGFSILAQREAGKMLLQHGLLLNGAIEPALALVGFTGEMARGYNTPGYDCPAVSWQSAGGSLYFKADGDGLGVSDDGYLDGADGFYSGGLVLLG